ncbi:MAG: hypothetical protein WAV72_14075 [Bradyrhizobium sp.]
MAVVDGTALPRPTKTPRKPRMTDADREATAIAASETIARLLPAYVELHRVWAKGTKAASDYLDANTSEAERYHMVRGPASDAADAIREASGAHAAQKAMSALHSKMATMARIIEIAPVASAEGLRAKTLAAMWECIPACADNVRFDFGENGRTLEMLFRACERMTGLSELAATLEARLGKDGKA